MKRGRPIKAQLILTRQPPHSMDLDAREIRDLSDEYRSLRESLNAAALTSIRRLGEILDQGWHLLEKDLYLEWLKSLCTSEQTAHNYRRVYRLSKSDPDTYSRVEDFQADKVYCLATVPKDARARVLDATLAGQCAADIGVKEFRALVREVLGRPVRPQSQEALASKLPARLDAAISALEQALAMHPRLFAEQRRLLLLKLRRICPLSTQLARRLGGGAARPKPPAPTAPTLPAKPRPKLPRPTTTTATQLLARKPKQ